jgi:hypothetical protein
VHPNKLGLSECKVQSVFSTTTLKVKNTPQLLLPNSALQLLNMQHCFCERCL